MTKRWKNGIYYYNPIHQRKDQLDAQKWKVDLISHISVETHLHYPLIDGKSVRIYEIYQKIVEIAAKL